MLFYLQLIDTPSDRAKFEGLYHTYRGLLHRIARRILQSEEDAEDAVHEAFIKIAKNISKFSEIKCPKTRTYLVLVVESTSKDLLRKRKETVPLEDTFGLTTEDLGNDALAVCFSRLSPLDRAVLLLRKLHGYSAREVAQMLDISEAAARKREQRAKSKLYELCKEAELL